jgi:uncharacterized membrane protein YsdA (DUF1294 family)
MNDWEKAGLIWLSVANTVALLAFAFDKWSAGRGGRRISEGTLLALGAVGGWLGGAVGMWTFSHKTAKGRFKFKYALGFVPFAAGIWMWWHWR